MPFNSVVLCNTEIKWEIELGLTVSLFTDAWSTAFKTTDAFSVTEEEDTLKNVFWKLELIVEFFPVLVFCGELTTVLITKLLALEGLGIEI